MATAFARNDLPVPGGPYSKMPRQGCLLPVKRWGNLIGRITASLIASFAPSNPATSSQRTFGFSVRIAPESKNVSGQVSSTGDVYRSDLIAFSSFLDHHHPWYPHCRSRLHSFSCRVDKEEISISIDPLLSNAYVPLLFGSAICTYSFLLFLFRFVIQIVF